MDLEVQVVGPVVTADQVSWFCFGVPASLILPDKADSTSKVLRGVNISGYNSRAYIRNYNQSGGDQINVNLSPRGQAYFDNFNDFDDFDDSDDSYNSDDSDDPDEFGYNTRNNANNNRGTRLSLGNILYVLTGLHFN